MTQGNADSIKQRLAAVRARMRDAAIDALVITAPENRQYLSGFASLDGEAGSLVVTQEHAALLTDSRYSEQAREEATEFEIGEERDELPQLVLNRLRAWGWGTAKAGEHKPVLGVEAEHLTVEAWEGLQRKARRMVSLKALKLFILPLRAVKDSAEIALTRRATEITCQTFDHLLDYLRQPGLTEKMVAAEVMTTMLRLGADGTAFDTIVACGANGARPHAVPGDVPLQPHQPIVIDMGARYQGYCADMTRTVFLQSVPDIWVERYNYVLAAQLACERGLHAGITGGQADALARDVLVKAGLGDRFTHSTGHGTGLNIHEAPNLTQRLPSAEVPLPAGAIVTIEPGVYLPGEGGIRIEDAAIVTNKGLDVLTTSPKELEAMIIR